SHVLSTLSLHDALPISLQLARKQSALLLDDSVNDVRGSLGVFGELHGVAGTSLGHGAYIRGVTKHLTQRNLSTDDLPGGRVFHTLNQTTTTVEVTHHVTHVVLRGHYFNFHDRL